MDVRRKTALVLSGGGITGFLFEIGVLAALEEALPQAPFHRYFDCFVGTSAGAVAAALLANGARPTDAYRVLREDLDSPFNFRPCDVYGVAGGTALQLITQFVRPLGGVITRALRNPTRPSLAAVLADFQEHHPPGFYSTEPLERTLCQRFTALGYAHHFHQLTSPLYVTGADIDTGERLVFGEGEFREVHICRAVAASAAVPIFFQPIRIGEREVVDGAVAEVSPLDVAVAHGADVIVHVNPLVPLYNDRTTLCLPLDGGHCASLAEKGVGWIGEQALRMLLAAKLEDTLEILRARHPQLVIHRIEPGRHELPIFMQHMMSFGTRRELLEYGLQCGRRVVKWGVVRTLTHSGASTPKMCPE
jgi:NTE family protein